jgi:FtsH-binding integral membrane protein
MNTPDFQRNFTVDEVSSSSLRAFMNRVFGMMSLALVISGVVAYKMGTPEMISYLIRPTGMTGLGWLVMLSPLAFILVMNFGINKLSPTALNLVFVGFAAVMGLSMSSIFLVYDFGTITKVFFITAGLFGFMAFLGFTTSTDLSKMGAILMMAVFGMIIASVVNWFMNSAQLDYIISCVGVLVFTGLTAYDVQKLKRIGMGVEYGDANSMKLATMGALNLYLDFINLFMFLLRIFGGNNRD